MSTHPHRRYTLDEYFALELASEERYEYFDGVARDMSAEDLPHALIVGNLIVTIGTQLRGRGCHVYSSNLRIKVPSFPPYRYADLTALCDTPHCENIGGIDALTNPSLLVEVLSPSTEAYDRLRAPQAG
jgi:Uma2 family endonuclease